MAKEHKKKKMVKKVQEQKKWPKSTRKKNGKKVQEQKKMVKKC